jgi:hypothetical protein
MRIERSSYAEKHGVGTPKFDCWRRPINRRCLTSGLVLIALLLTCCGCSTTPPPAAKSSGGNGTIPLTELDELTKGYADRYAMLVGSAVDSIKKDNLDPAQRRAAHRVMLDGILAINDIASSGDPYSQVLDLVVSVTLQARLWVDENRANEIFGDRAAPLIEALNTCRVEVWALAARTMTQEQLELLDYLALEWRRDHPNVHQVALVKFDDFADERAAGLLEDLKTGGGFLAPISETNVELREYRRLAERAFWYSKRAPNVAGLQAEAAVNEILAAPEIGTLLADTAQLSVTADRVGKTIQLLPGIVERERKAAFSEIDAQRQNLDRLVLNADTLTKDGGSLIDRTHSLLTTLDRTLNTAQSTIKTADTVASRYYVPTTSPSTQPGKPFDINDYNTLVSKVDDVVNGLNRLADSADNSSRSHPWEPMLKAVSDLADRRVEMVFRRIYGMIGLIVAGSIAFLLAKRALFTSKRGGEKP